MALGRDNRKNDSKRDGSGGAAVDEEENGVSDVTVDDRDDDRYEERDYAAAAEPATGRGFFDMYKPGQGFYTRVWSGIAYGALVAWFAYFLFEKFSLVGTHTSTTRYYQFGVATATIIGFGLLGYWLLALNRKVCDFLIATESEMKKVHWTSRREIIGSTKVVIFVMITLSVLLFVVDMLFLAFFSGIGVLRGGGVTEMVKGLF